VQAIQYTSSSYNFEILRGIVLYIFCFKINTLLCYTVVSVLLLDTGIARDQYYCILVIGLSALFGIILTLLFSKRFQPSKENTNNSSFSAMRYRRHVS